MHLFRGAKVGFFRENPTCGCEISRRSERKEQGKGKYHDDSHDNL